MLAQKLYYLTLMVAGFVNLTMSAALFFGNINYRYYNIYRRARILTGIFFAVFGVGFLLHYHFHWRLLWPMGATALSVSYFHIGGVAITWSHTSLLNPNYISLRVVGRDLAFLVIGLFTYWLAAFSHERLVMNCALFLFFVHALLMTVEFYRTYNQVSRRLMEMRLGNIEAFMRWMLLSCHLIIMFGIGSVAFTALLPTAVWPYTVLLCVGTLVFIYIFYSISEYGLVIDPATNATEDIVGVSYYGG